MERIKNKLFRLLPIFISLFLFVIPFFWFKPGEIDLGGDSSRLYFYDPIRYLTTISFYNISPSSLGAENISSYTIPFVVLLAVLKYIFGSPYILVSVFNGFSLAIAFLAIYATVKELLEEKVDGEIKELSAILSGLFYVFSQTPILGWDKVILTHNQFFLNPLMFFLLLLFLTRGKFAYLLIAILISFIFSPNFGFTAAPPFFAFYPLTILFLVIHATYIRKREISVKKLIIGILLFIAIHSFHLVPQLVSLSSPGSGTYEAVFSNEAKFNRGLSYFLAIASGIKVSINLMNLPQMMELGFSAFAFIGFLTIILLGFLWNRGRTLLLTGIFFLIALFFASANITNIGLNFYKALFNIPGFSMFRNFYGQWGYLYLFLYTILLGQALSVVLPRMKTVHARLFVGALVALLIITALPFINGTLVNKTLWQSKGTKIAIRMDPKYEEVLAFIRSLPVDGKVLTLPLTDPGYQIVAGKEGGAYQGPSTISYLTGKQDFACIEELGRFKELILDLARNKQYEKLKEVLGFLNIKYIFYNADPRIYDMAFRSFPYQHVRRFLPQDQKGYRQFLQELGLREIKAVDSKYFIYELDKEYRPKFFVTNSSNYFNKPIIDWSIPLSFEKEKSPTTTFFEYRYLPPFTENSFVEIEPTDIFLKVLKNPDPPRFLHHSFARVSPSSLLYPFIIMRENFSLKRDFGDSLRYIDRRMFFSAKRIFELELWGHDIPVIGTYQGVEELKRSFKNPKIWNLAAWRSENSWESILARYVENFDESIDKIEKINETNEWKTQQKFLLNEYLLQHRERLMSIIPSLLKKEEEGAYVDKLVDKMFEYLSDRLNFPTLDPSVITYSVGYPEKREAYHIYIEKKPLVQVKGEDFSIKLGHENLSKNIIQPEQNWVLFNVIVDRGKGTMPLTLNINKPRNTIKNAQFISLENNSKDLDTSFITALGGNFRNGLVWKINEWYPESMYFLSFEYKSDVPFSLRIFEQSNREKSKGVDVILKNQLKSRKWSKYQAVVRSSKYVDTAFLQLGGDNTSSPLPQVKLRNLSLIYLPHSKAYLKKSSDGIKDTQLPKIVFEKINPTKYRIQVSRANNPYFLVFNNAFNKRWELFLSEKQSNLMPMISYFSNNVEEGSHTSSFLNKEIFDTLRMRSIDGKSHFQVNSYANAWYIEPKDVGGRTEYELIVEMTTQKLFYASFLISVATAFLCLLILIKTLFKE